MNATELRQFAKELRVVTDRQLDDSEVLKGLREAASAKGIDWTQLKALVRAQAQDARDDGQRVEKLVERAEFASAYADMLATNMNEHSESRSSRPDAIVETPAPDPIAPQTTVQDVLPPAAFDMPDIPAFLDRRQPQTEGAA